MCSSCPASRRAPARRRVAGPSSQVGGEALALRIELRAAASGCVRPSSESGGTRWIAPSSSVFSRSSARRDEAPREGGGRDRRRLVGQGGEVRGEQFGGERAVRLAHRATRHPPPSPGCSTSGAAATAWRTASRAGCRNGSATPPERAASGSRRWPNCRNPISASRSSATSAVRGSEAIVTRTAGSPSPARAAAGWRRGLPRARLPRCARLARPRVAPPRDPDRGAARARGRTRAAASGSRISATIGAAARSAPDAALDGGQVEAREALIDDELEHRHLGVHQRAHGAVAALQAQVARVEPLGSRRRRRSARRSASRRRRRAAPPSDPRHPGRT